MEFNQFRASLDLMLKGSLSSAGFDRRRQGLWNRRRGDEINVIYIQKHSAEPLFCIAAGAHYSFVPIAGVNTAVSNQPLTPPDCEIQFRITDHPNKNDQWWAINQDSVDMAYHVIYSRGIGIFENFKLPGPISNITAEDVEKKELRVLHRLPLPRACLLLARIYEHEGDFRQCQKIAQIGIQESGQAVSVRKSLKDVMARCAQNPDIDTPGSIGQ
jgi:hypothetical protein